MSYLLENPDIMLRLLWQHLQMTTYTLVGAIALAVPIAWAIYTVPSLRKPVMSVLSVFYTIPSLALIILLVPLFGLNQWSVIAAMVVYTQVILVRNLLVGLESIDPAILEAASGMGMSLWQRWWMVQVPLVIPVFLAGVRLSSIVAIAIATIGAKVGAGGLWTLLFEGIAQAGRYDKIWAGAIAVSLLAFAFNGAFLLLERYTQPARSTVPQS
jgi:osmoprotectant transport system permease protein